MAQQCLNFLFKQAKKAVQGKDVTKQDRAFGYLNEIESISTVNCHAKCPEDFLDLELID